MEKIFYFAQLFNSLNTLFITLVIISIVTLIFTGLRCICEPYLNNEEISVVKKITKYIILSLIIGTLGLTFCPTKQTYLFMVGGKVVDKLVENNPQLKEIPGNTIDLLNEYIKLETEKIRNKSE